MPLGHRGLRLHPRKSRICEEVRSWRERFWCIETAQSDVDDFRVTGIDARYVRAAGGTKKSGALRGRVELDGRRRQIPESFHRNDQPSHIRCGVDVPTHRAMAVHRHIRAVIDCVSDFLAEAPTFDHVYCSLFNSADEFLLRRRQSRPAGRRSSIPEIHPADGGRYVLSCATPPLLRTPSNNMALGSTRRLPGL
jgi:hypothetical protein